MTTTITTEAELYEWSENFDTESAFIEDAEGHSYVLFADQDGELYATRPPHEDDDAEHIGKGVTLALDALTLPLTVQPSPAVKPSRDTPSYVYVASSWRNPDQPAVVDAVRASGVDAYDFRNPEGGTGFAWSEIDPAWQGWTADEYVAALEHPRAVEGFASDFDAMKRADIVVLILPCGRSAHLELGWAVGAGKRTAILTRDGEEPELMAKMVDHIATSLDGLLAWIGEERP